MDFDLSSFTATLAALSVASERLTEIIKGTLVAIPYIPTGWLETKQTVAPVPAVPGAPAAAPQVNQAAEARRQLFIHILSGLAGIATAQIAKGNMGEPLNQWAQSLGGNVLIGVLVSGGSGLWNSFGTYVKAAKDVKTGK